MQVRFRILQASPARSVLSLEGFRERPPQEVSAVDGTASLKQLQTLIAGRDLKLTDLVDVGNGWETLGDCQALKETVASVNRSKFPLKRILVLWLIVVILSILQSVYMLLST
jgi:hypothetical protein